jgi:uncharacterized glyoxalase superfamily protein PhnB
MKPMPVIFVKNMKDAIAFYGRLGLKVKIRARSGSWTVLENDGAYLGLHWCDANEFPPLGRNRVEVCFESEDSLELVSDGLTRAGVEIERPFTDEAFGSSIEVRDPDGLAIQIQHSEEPLFT